MAALPFDATCASFEARSLSLTLSAEHSSHFSSFLGFTWKLLALSLFYLINGTASLVAIVIKSNEVSTGWGFVESAVSNWRGRCLRWASALCPQGNEIVFRFSSSRVSEVSNCVSEALLRCTLLYVWMVVLVFGLKGYRAGDVEEMSWNKWKCAHFVSWIIQRHWSSNFSNVIQFLSFFLFFTKMLRILCLNMSGFPC